MSGARAGDITIDGLNIGKASGLTDAIQIIGATGKSLECDEIIISNVVATALSLENSEIYELVLTNNIADGLSVSPTLDNAVLDIVVQSTRGTVSVLPSPMVITIGLFCLLLLQVLNAERLRCLT